MSKETTISVRREILSMAKVGIARKFWFDLMMVILEDEGFSTGESTREFVRDMIKDAQEMLRALEALEMYRVR